MKKAKKLLKAIIPAIIFSTLLIMLLNLHKESALFKKMTSLYKQKNYEEVIKLSKKFAEKHPNSYLLSKLKELEQKAILEKKELEQKAILEKKELEQKAILEKPLELHLKNCDVKKIFRIFPDLYNVEIVLGEGIEGQHTVEIRGENFKDLLNKVTEKLGYMYIQTSKGILVYNPELEGPPIDVRAIIHDEGKVIVDAGGDFNKIVKVGDTIHEYINAKVSEIAEDFVKFKYKGLIIIRKPKSRYTHTDSQLFRTNYNSMYDIGYQDGGKDKELDKEYNPEEAYRPHESYINSQTMSMWTGGLAAGLSAAQIEVGCRYGYFDGYTSGYYAISKTEDKVDEEWWNKGYKEGYQGGLVDKSASKYDGLPYAPEEVWNQISHTYYTYDISKLPAEKRAICFESFKKGWFEGYKDGWYGHPKKEIPASK